MTINQQLYLIRQFAINHLQINSHLFAPEYDLHGEHNQPGFVLWWYLEPSTLQDTMTETTFVFTIMDVLNDGNSNLEDILSDTNTICLDLVTYLDYNSDSFNPAGVQYNYDIKRVGSIEPGEQMFNSRFAGHTMRVTFQQGFAYDLCSIPIDLNDNFEITISNSDDSFLVTTDANYELADTTYVVNLNGVLQSTTVLPSMVAHTLNITLN